MPSPDRSPEGGAPDLQAFVSEHGLDPALVGPLEALLRARHGLLRTATMTALAARPRPAVADTQELVSADTHTLQTPAELRRGAPTTPAVVPLAWQREERLGFVSHLASGGMGEVNRVHDRWLGRMLVMKVLHVALNDDAEMRTRFLEEGQITAQLAHPGIPPVHELGELPDGRPFFTMKEVHGRTLAQVLTDHRQGKAGGAWSVRRLLEVFQKVCEAVAYAHARGVVHCDLKPSNIMVGAFGQVMVMDWGVAQLVAPATSAPTSEAPVETLRGREEALRSLAGTFGYMPPEQACGDLTRLAPAADVFALGVILFEILAGHRPYRGEPAELIELARRGVIPPLGGADVDEALEGIVRRALAPEPGDRYPDASALADVIGRWREGALRREKALAVVDDARGLLPEVDPKRLRALALRDEARVLLDTLGPAAGAEAKAAAWAKQDEAAALDRDAGLVLVRVAQLLQAALVHSPDLAEAKALLARIHYKRHRAAERRRQPDEAARHEILLRAHDVGEFRDYLAGKATLTVATDAPCRVRLLRFVEVHRRLVPELVRELGPAPLTD